MLTKYRANLPELTLESEMNGLGWDITKRGWPDFVCWRNGKMACIEVKPHSSSPLKATQRRIMEALIAAGIPCFRWDPRSGFTDLDNRPVHFRHSVRLRKFIFRSNEFRENAK